MNTIIEHNLDLYEQNTYPIHAFQCRLDGRIRFTELCTLFEDTAATHMEKLGISFQTLHAYNLSWVISRMRVKIIEYPTFGDEMIVLSFAHTPRKLSILRDFIMTFPDGRPIGYATTEWMTIHRELRRPMPLLEKIQHGANHVRTPIWGKHSFEKLSFKGDNQPACENNFTVRHNHIDLNGHVNNIHYIEWLLEGVQEFDRGLYVQELQIRFKAEAFLGNKITTHCAHDADGNILHQATLANGTELTCAHTRWFNPEKA